MDNKFVYRKDINLLDRVNDKALKSNIKGTFAIVVAIILVFLILASIFIPKMIISSRETELEGLNKQLKSKQILDSHHSSLSSNLSTANNKKAELDSFDNGGATKVLEWLEEMVPSEGVKIDTLEVKSDSIITITGKADDEKTIADFYANVRSNENVVLVAVSGAESEIINGREVMGFSMTITYLFIEE